MDKQVRNKLNHFNSNNLVLKPLYQALKVLYGVEPFFKQIKKHFILWHVGYQIIDIFILPIQTDILIYTPNNTLLHFWCFYLFLCLNRGTLMFHAIEIQF